MPLLDRYIEVSSWTTSRKLTLLMGVFALPGHVAALIVIYLGLGGLDFVDNRRLIVVGWALVAVCLVAFVVGLVTSRRPGDHHWTYLVLVIPHGPLAAYVVYELGGASTALLAWYPMAAVIILLWFDRRAGLFSASYGLVYAVGVLVVGALPGVDFAPALLDRSVDAQTNPWFIAAIAILVLLFWILAFTTAYLVASSRDSAESSLKEAHARLDEAARLVARYVPAEIAEGIFAGGVATDDAHQRRKITVFFSDIVGFSDIAEDLEPEDLAQVVNEYFTEMTAIARRHHGTVDELQGDALLILFGAPHFVDHQQHARDAVSMAVEMLAAVAVLNERWERAGITARLQVRMGLNTGVVTVGSFGSPERMKFAALGRHVNIAARIQAACTPGSVLISRATWLLVRDSVPCRPVGPLTLKGVPRPVDAYEVVSLDSASPSAGSPA
jgi:class 3 adenylate cyclase